VDSQRNNTDQAHVSFVRFAADGTLLLGNSWNERNEQVRSRDLKTGQARWAFQGMTPMQGLCVAADKTIYCLRDAGIKETFQLARLDPETGMPKSWEGDKIGLLPLPGAGLDGMDELDGLLYIADSKGNRVHVVSASKPVVGKALEVADPHQPTADRRRKVVWLLSGTDKVVALAPDGKIVSTFSGIRLPLGIAVAGDRLVVASAATGKLHLFDCADPANLKPIKTVGRGDGPYGPLVADRFHFQAAAWR
jgi:hypothetical protein